MPKNLTIIPLAGSWGFALDPEQRGLPERWFLRTLTGSARLPGSTDENGQGMQQTEDPELWGALTRAWTYEGQAWYQRSISIPASWAGQQVRLFLERCHWSSRVWIDDQEIGSDRSLLTPHIYELPVSPGEHRLTILIDNRMLVDIGSCSHSITDHSQTNWNGIIGRIELQAHAPLWAEKIRVVPDYDRRRLEISGLIRNAIGRGGAGRLTVRLCRHGRSRALLECEQTIAALADSTPFTFGLDLHQIEVERWDEWTQGRYEIEIAVDETGQPGAFSCRVPFGWRDLRVVDKRLRLNDRWVLLRGTVEDCVFPLTGYPPMTLAPWRRIFRLLREHGLNHVRFHSWCPPEAAFIAADELGLLLQPELPAWAWCRPGSPLSEFLQFEGRRVLDTYGHHPSFALFALGNELPGDLEHMDALTGVLRDYDQRRRLMTSHAGCRSPMSQMEFFVNSNVGLHSVRISGRFNETGRTSAKPAAWTPGDHRGLGQANQAGRHSGDGTSRDYRAAVAECPIPLVVHELGQHVVHPDFSEIRRYTGVLKPFSLIHYHQRLRRNGLGGRGLLRQFQQATGHLAWKCFYKEDVEIIHRTPGMGGYQLLQMNDFPGQGESLVGAFDAFWNNKGLFSPAEYRGFAGATVPLAALPRFVWRADETLTAAVSVAHYGAADLQAATVHWSVVDSATGAERAAGQWPGCHLRQGEVTAVGSIELPLAGLPSPAAFSLRLSLDVGSERIENQWTFWSYPVEVPAEPSTGILIATRDDQDLRTALAEGRSVLLTLTDLRSSDYQDLIRAVFSPVFWSIRNIPTVHPGTMGLLADPAHPAFAGFPTGTAADFQWMELINGAIAFNLRQQAPGLQPLVRCIDDFHRGNPLAYLLEGRVGRGRLLLSGFDLIQDLDRRFAACRLRNSLLQYMASPAFAPRQTIDLDRLFVPRGLRYAKVLSTDAEKPGFEAWRILDADWYSGWETPEAGPNYPHHIIIDLGLKARFRGVRYVPFQQKPVERHGVIREFAIFASDQPDTWGEPIITRTLVHSNRLVHDLWLERPITARYLRFVALSGFRGVRHAAVGELELLEFEHLADGPDRPTTMVYDEAAPVDDDRFVVEQ